jgi:hypothetical protein
VSWQEWKLEGSLASDWLAKQTFQTEQATLTDLKLILEKPISASPILNTDLEAPLDRKLGFFVNFLSASLLKDTWLLAAAAAAAYDFAPVGVLFMLGSCISINGYYK